MSGAARSWRGDILARLHAKLVLLHSHIWGAAAEAVREKVAVSDLCVRRNGGPGTDIAVSCMQRTWYGSRKTCEGTDSLCRFSAASLEPSRGLREGDGCDVCGKGGKQP